MCESVVFLKEGSGVSAVMTDAIDVRSDSTGIICTSIAGEKVALTEVAVAEVDLLRHRIILRRV